MTYLIPRFLSGCCRRLYIQEHDHPRRLILEGLVDEHALELTIASKIPHQRRGEHVMYDQRMTIVDVRYNLDFDFVIYTVTLKNTQLAPAARARQIAYHVSFKDSIRLISKPDEFKTIEIQETSLGPTRIYA